MNLQVRTWQWEEVQGVQCGWAWRRPAAPFHATPRRNQSTTWKQPTLTRPAHAAENSACRPRSVRYRYTVSPKKITLVNQF